MTTSFFLFLISKLSAIPQKLSTITSLYKNTPNTKIAKPINCTQLKVSLPWYGQTRKNPQIITILTCLNITLLVELINFVTVTPIPLYNRTTNWSKHIRNNTLGVWINCCVASMESSITPLFQTLYPQGTYWKITKRASMMSVPQRPSHPTTSKGWM